jgi:hypothetical protein
MSDNTCTLYKHKYNTCAINKVVYQNTRRRIINVGAGITHRYLSPHIGDPDDNTTMTTDRPTDAADIAPRTIRRSSNALKISPAGWRILPPSRVNSTLGKAALAPAIVTPTHEVALLADLPLDMTLPTLCAGTTNATKTGHNTVLSPAPSTHRETSTADVSSGTRLHYRHRPSLHRQEQQAPVPNRHGFRPLRVPSQAHPSAQDHVLITTTARPTALPSPHR